MLNIMQYKNTTPESHLNSKSKNLDIKIFSLIGCVKLLGNLNSDLK